jgi:hypothetical protein
MHPVDPSIITDGSTFINPIGVAFTLLMCVLLVLLPRRYALLPILALVCYMTMGMRFVIGGLNFPMLRIVLFFGWARLVLRGEMKSVKLNPIDKTIIALVVVNMVAFTVQWGDFDAFKNQLGGAYTVLGFFFLFRFLVRDKEDILSALKIFSVLVVPLAGAMVLEKITGRDPFAIFGGVPEISFVRDGAIRCEGPFAHPILAGTFGATVMPFWVGLWWQKGSYRVYALLGVISSLIITFTSASSGPILAFAFGALGLCLWTLRARMRAIRWGIVAFLGALQLAMKPPFWYVMTKVPIVDGSDSYHRAYLIDRCIANFSDWWLIGTKSTEAWAEKDSHLFDVTNAYILAGANGGLLAMILYITIIVLAFKGVGRVVRSMEGKDPKESLQLTWALGASLLAHAVTFIAVSYFDQNFVNWYFLLAMISTVTGPLLIQTRHEFIASLQQQFAGGWSPVPASGFARQGRGASANAGFNARVGTDPQINGGPKLPRYAGHKSMKPVGS